MQHASADAIARLAPLIGRIRALPGLTEKRPGVFYRRSTAFLHFHEDGGRLFADVRLEGVDFQRFDVTTTARQTTLLTAIRQVL